MPKTLCALGLMSGTSLDGIDAALLYTDGHSISKTGAHLTLPYAPVLRDKIRGLLTGTGDTLLIEKEITLAHADAVGELLKKAALTPNDIDIIGFHGQTIIHRPQEALTWQIGNGGLLAERTGINVICDFRRRDMAAGGQGAPLVPLYHAAITRHLPKPLVIVNIGGVANVTYIGHDDSQLLAFDTGPGNALLDDWILSHTGSTYDDGGKIAASGTIDENRLAAMLAHPFFKAPPPKSLDRNDFDKSILAGLSLADGAATLTAFTSRALSLAREFFPESPTSYFIAGGGRHNHHMMELLTRQSNVPVMKIDETNYNGDALEAQAFAFLAVRSLYGMPLSMPGTTGVNRPVTGGAFYRA